MEVKQNENNKNTCCNFLFGILILTAIGIYLIIKDSISLYSIADSLPYGFIRDSAIYLFNLF